MFSDILCSYNTFKVIGAAIVGVKLVELSAYVLRTIYFRLKCIAGYSPWKSIGSWAVVTGGTDGIGKAYAEELAAKGFSVCLMSRNTEKLRVVAEEIEANYSVSTKVINVDFTSGPEIYQIISQQLKELDGGIGVLVNNVGMSYKYAEYFHEVPNGFDTMINIVHSNVTSCTMMMRMVIPMMKDKGIIINVASLMAVYPMPMLATYSACKAYVDYLSRATWYEYKDKGIVIQCVLPAYVSTNMSKRKRSVEIPTAQEYVASAMKTVGLENYTYGFWAHNVRGFVHQWLKSNMPARFNLALSLHFMTKNKKSYFRKLKREIERKETKN